MSSDNGGGGGFFAGFLVGAVVGGAVAALLTKDETRDVLVEKAREAGGAARDVTSQWQSSASELYERGKKVVENARANIDAAVDEGMSAADQSRQDLQRKAEE